MKVTRPFFDLTDKNWAYFPGDTFPREGKEVTAERLAELATSNNRLGYPVIEEVKEQEEKPSRRRVKKDVD